MEILKRKGFMWTKLPSINNSIAAKLLAAVFSIYFIITLTVTAVHMIAEYYSAKQNVIDDLHTINQTFSPSIANFLWNLDEDGMASAMSGIQQFPIIEGILIHDKGEEIERVGKIMELEETKSNGSAPTASNTSNQFGGLFGETFLIKGPPPENEIIGKMTLYSSTGVVFEKVQYGFLFIIINSIIKTIALWVIFLWVSRYFLSRPLGIFTKAAQQLNLDRLDQHKLDIKSSGKDELKILEDAFNAMVQKLRDVYQSLHHANQLNQSLSTILQEDKLLFEATNQSRSLLGADCAVEIGLEANTPIFAYPPLDANPTESAKQELLEQIAQTNSLTRYLPVNSESHSGRTFLKALYPNEKIGYLIIVLLYHQEERKGVLLLSRRSHHFSTHEAELLSSIATQLSVSWENAILYSSLEEKVMERTAELAQANKEIHELNEQLKSENLRMSMELDVARQLQQMVLPPNEELQSIQDLEITGFMRPADEVGGDYYDIFQHHDGHTMVCIGDVTGHGLKSGVLMLMAQTAVRTIAAMGETDPIRFFATLNRTIFENVQRMHDDRNLSLLLMDYQNGQLRISGQHEQVIVVRNGGNIELIDTIDLGFPIGLEANIEDFVSEKTISLSPGEGAVLFTDGITEAENIHGEQFEIERLSQIICDNWDRPVQEIKQTIIDDLTQFIGKQTIYDDLTLVILKQL